MTSRLARLEWERPEGSTPETVDRLTGNGARFELAADPQNPGPVGFVRRPRTLRAMLDRRVSASGEAHYLVEADCTWTFAEAAEDIGLLASYLQRRHGVTHGDRVAFVSANSAEYGLAMWAVLSLGAVVTSLNGWWTGPELAYGIELSAPVLLLGDSRRLRRLDDVDLADDLAVRTLEDLWRSARDDVRVPPSFPEIDDDDAAVILFTSGTTGRPKGATLSHRNIVHVGEVFAASGALAGGTTDVDSSSVQPASILSSPMFHVSGMIGIFISGPALGGKSVFAPPGRWDPTEHLRLTEAHRITRWSGVPTQLWRLLRHPDLDEFDLGTLRSVGSGGATFPPALTRQLNERLPWVSLGNGYGMSETVGLGTVNGPAGMRTHPDSVGVPQIGTTVEVRDPDGVVLQEDEVGEIHIRCQSVFLGYWRDPEATNECLTDDGWYRTGDFGRIAAGRLHLASRMRDLIVRGGENIYPVEVENRLVEHPNITDAAVIGVDHEELGQEVKAFIVASGAEAPTAQDIREWVASTLARFKVPTHVAFVSSLPYTDTGKVIKLELEG